MTEFTPNESFEKLVQNALAAPQPRPEFVNRVYGELMQRAAQSPAHPRPVFGLRRSWAISLAVLAVLLIGTLAVGPQQVQATFKRLLGYIPVCFAVNTRESVFEHPRVITHKLHLHRVCAGR